MTTPPSADRERLVALHGFTQTHRHLHALAFGLAAACGIPAVALPDLPGHGLSGDDREPFQASVDGLAGRCGPGTYLGYSMGGRFGLAAAIASPGSVRRLVLIGATPGLEDPVEAAERRAADEERADSLEEFGVETFLDAWMRLPMFAGLPPDDQGLALRRANTAAGLAHSLRTAGTGSMPSLWDRLGEIEVPTMLVTGELDEKFTAIADRMAGLIPDATHVVIDGAGHAAHLERPTDTTTVIADWLSGR